MNLNIKMAMLMESEITGVLKGLGFSKEDFNRHTDTLSGGQKTRLSLGRLLLLKPDIIILDEPTNHLDMESIRWLETFLIGYQGSVILVSTTVIFWIKLSQKLWNSTRDIVRSTTEITLIFHRNVRKSVQAR